MLPKVSIPLYIETGNQSYISLIKKKIAYIYIYASRWDAQRIFKYITHISTNINVSSSTKDQMSCTLEVIH